MGETAPDRAAVAHRTISDASSDVGSSPELWIETRTISEGIEQPFETNSVAGSPRFAPTPMFIAAPLADMSLSKHEARLPSITTIAGVPTDHRICARRFVWSFTNHSCQSNKPLVVSLASDCHHWHAGDFEML